MLCPLEPSGGREGKEGELVLDRMAVLIPAAAGVLIPARTLDFWVVWSRYF
jgi:hypothetical protein